MKGLITNYHQTGEYELNIERACKKWNDQTIICLSYFNDIQVYTYAKVSKNQKKVITRIKISAQQATELIHRMKLVQVRDSFFRRACTYKTLAKAEAEEEEISAEIERLESQLFTLQSMRDEIKKGINSYLEQKS
jgi:hypothetical protein